MLIEKGKRYLTRAGEVALVGEHPDIPGALGINIRNLVVRADGTCPYVPWCDLIAPLGEWVEHETGAPCPLPADVLVKVRIRSGIESVLEGCAKEWVSGGVNQWVWKNDPNPYDITHYLIPSSQFEQGERSPEWIDPFKLDETSEPKPASAEDVAIYKQIAERYDRQLEINDELLAEIAVLKAEIDQLRAKLTKAETMRMSTAPSRPDERPRCWRCGRELYGATCPCSLLTLPSPDHWLGVAVEPVDEPAPPRRTGPRWRAMV